MATKPRGSGQAEGDDGSTLGGPIDPPPDTLLREVDDAEDPRRVAHELVGLAHAVLAIAGREDVLPHWCPEELRLSVRDSGAGLAAAIGELHAEIASGEYDVGLRAAGIGDTVGKPKRRGFRQAVEGLRRVTGRIGQGIRQVGADLRADRPKAIRAWLKNAAGWGKLVIDSVASEVPGGHVVKEGLDLIRTVIEGADAVATLPPPKAPSTAQRST